MGWDKETRKFKLVTIDKNINGIDKIDLANLDCNNLTPNLKNLNVGGKPVFLKYF